MLRIAKCSLGHTGLVTNHEEIFYLDGEKALAYTGYHLLPLRLFGKRWSSRRPKWIL